MNTIYKIIWNETIKQWIVTSELGKRSKSTLRKVLVASIILTSSAYSLANCGSRTSGSEKLITASDGKSCKLDNNANVTIYEFKGITPIVINNNSNVDFTNFDSIIATSTGNGYGIEIGRKSPGGEASFNHLEVEASSYQNSRGIILGENAKLTVNGVLQVSKDHNGGAAIELESNSNTMKV
ncbi:MAG: ESPR domain-containing protein, partial [Lactobacillaceae bacterium]